ncbi:MAG: NADH-quinone oxidoreductase subunit H [Spirochaetaceae bacterium]|nr:MAG: NADH-quinone oxidoreductase subunit H [Spirochaetaceae bacterium]
MEIGWYILAFIVFPGFLFTSVVGLLSSWVDRKVTARVQWRVGPPLFQPFYDFVKLLGKETLIPSSGARGLFLAAPIFGLGAVTLVSTILWLANLNQISFVGDLIVVVYLLVVPSLAIMMGGMASGNPLASTGASREMKLILSYELPFLICLATVILKSNFSIRLVEIAENHVFDSVSGVLAGVVALLCVQAKLGFTPFDIAEAETEIMSGPYIEYSGVSLGVFKLTQAMMLFTLPVFLITVFLGGIHLVGWGILWAILKYVAILVLIIVIKNTNPRIRIDQAVKFFWFYLTPITIAAFVLAVLGRTFEIPWL